MSSSYQNLDLSSSPTASQITPEVLISLRQKLQETRKLHTALSAEKVRNDALIAQLRALLGLPAQAPITTTTDSADSDTAKAEPTHPPTTFSDTFSFLTNQPS